MQHNKRTVEPNGSHCRCSISPATALSKFFKIILPSIIHEKKLRIPEKFVRKYGDELSAVAMLTVPTGHGSHVRLEKLDKMIWFCEGWQQFMERNSIGCFYFLVFKYKGNSNFDVLIFDLTASEIQYGFSIRRSFEGHNNGKQSQLSDVEEIEDDDLSVEILGSLDFVGSSSKFSRGLNKKGKSASLVERLEPTPPYLTRSKRYKQDQEQMIKLENLQEACGRKPCRSQMSNWHDSLSDKSKRKNQFVTKNVETLQAPTPPVRDRGFQLNESELMDKREIIDVEEQHPVINQARERTINAARMFKPENPFHMFILRSYNVNGYLLCIPSEFAKKMKYLVGVSDFVKLQVSDGKEWRVRCIPDKGGTTKLSKGWGTFVKENNLVEEDVCVFELIKAKDFVVKVSIFRTAAYAGQANQSLK